MDEQDLLEVFVRARALIATLDSWTTWHFAADAGERWVPVGSDAAVRFNLQGALMRSAGPRTREAMIATDALGEKPPAVALALALTTPAAEAHQQALSFLDATISRLSRERGMNRPSATSGVMLRVSQIPDISRKNTGGSDE